MEYTFDVLRRELEKIREEFPYAETGFIGYSVRGRELFYIRLGRGERAILYNGAHHGMERITSAMLMKFAENFLKAEKEGGNILGFSPGVLGEKVSLYIVPMVNPDGVDLAVRGLTEEYSKEDAEALVKINGGSRDFGRWQANVHGVDLNHNYDAMWKESKKMEEGYGIFGAGPTRFSGSKPLSEPESRALAEFTEKKNVELSIAFHSQGKVIYQGFQGKEPEISLEIARAFEKISPYKIDYTEGIASYGGYKDWFVDKFRRPGFTVEVGEGENPLPAENLPIIYRETLPILLGAMTV